MTAEPLAMPASPPPWRDVLAGTQGRLIVGLLVLETLFALHFMTVATIMPAVLKDLGNLALYGWSFTAASLGQLGVIPIAGAAVDRFGPRRILAMVATLYTVGLLVAASAPTMAVVAGGRFLQGIAAGAAYALSLGVVAKALPARHRARVMALLATTWLLPGLFGPPLGALLAETVGWRYAFIVPLPVLAACLVMIMPSLRGIAVAEAGAVPLARPLLLMVGAGAFFAGLTAPGTLSIPVALAGLAIAVVALRGLVPDGTFRAARGPAAAAVAAFLLSTSFVAAENFLPLMFTDVRGRTLTEVAIVLAVIPFTWAAGSWWQSRAVEHRPPSTLVTVGGALVLLGFGTSASGLVPGVPLWLAYAGWPVAATGMGIAFPTIPLAVMSWVREGAEGRELSPTLLMDMVGVALGAGLAGASLAIADRSGASLTAGLGGAFAVSGVASLFLLMVARRISVGPPATRLPD